MRHSQPSTHLKWSHVRSLRVHYNASGTPSCRPINSSRLAPRIVRAEQPGPDGVLTGTVLYRASTQLTLALPDLPQLIQVGLYQPRWTGTTWILDLIATFAVAGPR